MNPSDSVEHNYAQKLNGQPVEDCDSDEVLSDREKALAAEAERLRMTVVDLQMFYWVGLKGSDVPADWGCRAEMLNYLRKHQEAPARWVMVSGLWPGLEKTEGSADRRRKLRALYVEAVREIQFELREHERDPDCKERSIYWDPICEVCRTLGIAPSKLSGYCREFCGLSLKEVIDCERVRSVKGKILEGVRRELGALNVGVREEEVSRKGAKAQRKANGGDKWVVWGELKKARRWPEFSRESWAQGLGFASYRRLYKACMAVYRSTPCQMELAAVGEIVGEGDCLSQRREGAENGGEEGGGDCLSLRRDGAENGGEEGGREDKEGSGVG